MYSKKPIDAKKLVTDLPPAVHDIMFDGTTSQSAVWMTSTMNTHLIRALMDYSSTVAKDVADPKDTEFWSALTHSHRRGEIEEQFAACEYHLGLDMRDRFTKRNFITKLQQTFLGSVSRIDAERDAFLDQYGMRLLPSYKTYKDILHMNWENPDYSFPEDRAEREIIVLQQE